MRTQLSPAFGWIACSRLQALCRVASFYSVSQVLLLFPVSQPPAFASDQWDRAVAWTIQRRSPKKTSLDHRIMWLMLGYVSAAGLRFRRIGAPDDVLGIPFAGRKETEPSDEGSC